MRIHVIKILCIYSNGKVGMTDAKELRVCRYKMMAMRVFICSSESNLKQRRLKNIKSCS